MTAAAPDLVAASSLPPRAARLRREAPRALDMAPAAEPTADRAARLALAVAAAVGELQAHRGCDTRAQARLDLAELEALLGVADAALPAAARAQGGARRAWEGAAPPPDAEQDAAALACWAALGEPVEAHLLTWRAALRGRHG